MTNLMKRILVGAVGIPVAVGTIYMGGWVFAIGVIVITSLALREFYTLAESKAASPNVPLGIAWSILLQITIAKAAESPDLMGLGMFAIGVLLFITGTLATLTAELFRARENALLNTALTVFGVAFITTCMSGLLMLRAAKDDMLAGAWGDAGATLILIMFVAVWTCDSAAYFVGVNLGKHKLFPRVSPKKSWEGAIAGLLASVIVFIGLCTWLMPSFGLFNAAACGLIAGIFGQIGDLVESLLKRDAIVKDSGGILPGHGGIFDRFDSMLFVAPLVMIYIALLDIIPAFLP